MSQSPSSENSREDSSSQSLFSNHGDAHESGGKKPSSWPVGLSILVAILLGALFGLWLRNQFVGTEEAPIEVAAPVSPMVGEAFDGIALEALVNTEGSVGSEELQGKVVWVNIWGTWCPPCRREFPDILEVYRKHAGHSDFEFLSVTYPQGAGPIQPKSLAEVTNSFLKMQGAEKMPVYWDPRASTFSRLMQLAQRVGGRNEQPAFPTSMILNRDGKITGYWVGALPDIGERIDERLEATFAGKGLPSKKSDEASPGEKEAGGSQEQ
jgi:thiol-disulfide isomerase/thioredoxin